MLVGHPFARRAFNPRDENGNEGCAICGYSRGAHAAEPTADNAKQLREFHC